MLTVDLEEWRKEVGLMQVAFFEYIGSILLDITLLQIYNTNNERRPLGGE